MATLLTTSLFFVPRFHDNLIERIFPLQFRGASYNTKNIFGYQHGSVLERPPLYHLVTHGYNIHGMISPFLGSGTTGPSPVKPVTDISCSLGIGSWHGLVQIIRILTSSTLFSPVDVKNILIQQMKQSTNSSDTFSKNLLKYLGKQMSRPFLRKQLGCKKTITNCP